MTPENRKKYDAKLKRINDAIALREPDMVPMTPAPELFPILNAGYTVAEVIYDTSMEKTRKAVLKYLSDFDPDAGAGVGFNYAGEGPVLELIGSKNMRWAGMPGATLDVNSLQQFIEYPLLLDDEFDEFFSDRTGWQLNKALPRSNSLFDPLATLRVGDATHSVRPLAHTVSSPEYRAMIEKLWAIDEYYKGYDEKVADIQKEVSEMGYPLMTGGMAGVPYDQWSDFLRGTMLTMEDLYFNVENMTKFMAEAFEQSIERIKASKGINEGMHVMMPLHKGMDGFMNDAQYKEYYWKDLQRIILAIIESGKIPYIYTEGKYNSRLDCLTEVPPGKVFYHFEEVDMAVAKKKLGGIACISGGFPTILLQFGTKQQVIDEARRLIDICAPGGGFIFETSCGMSHCKRENVEALFDTVRKYGKY